MCFRQTKLNILFGSTKEKPHFSTFTVVFSDIESADSLGTFLLEWYGEGAVPPIIAIFGKYG